MKDIEIYKGKSQILNFVIKDRYDEIIDLGSATGKIKVFLQKPGQNDVFVIEKTLTIDSVLKGEVSITLDDNDTDISVADYKYLLEFSYGADDNRVLGEGKFTISGDDIVRINQIKTKYGLEYDEYSMLAAISWSHKQMKNNAFIAEEKDFKSKKDEFIIENYVMDNNFDNIVNKDDIDIIEFMSKTPYTVKDLKANISNIIFNHPSGNTIIQMDNKYPSGDGYAVRISYHRAVESHEKAIENIKRVEELYVIYHLFDILEPYKLQKGLPSRTINGVSIDFDRDGVDLFKKKLFMEINNEIMKFRPFKARSVLMNKGY